MKEKIYTIPITESYEQDSECPFCFLEKKLENEAVDYALGAAMMEPDYRLVSNDKGYCSKHFAQMFASPNKLSLALILDTHLEEVIKKLASAESFVNGAGSKKGGLFRKSAPPSSDSELVKTTAALQSSCVICDKLNETISRYTEVFFYMWEKDAAFREKVLSSKGLCLKHFGMLTEKARDCLKSPDEFIKPMYNLEMKNLNRIKEDIHKFTLKFDYRNKDMPWGTAEDAPIRTIEKLRGYNIPVKKDEK